MSQGFSPPRSASGGGPARLTQTPARLLAPRPAPATPPHRSGVGPGHQEAGFSVRPPLSSQRPRRSMQFHKPWRAPCPAGPQRTGTASTSLAGRPMKEKRGQHAGREHGGALGPLQSSSAETSLALRKRPPFRPSPFMIRGQAGRSTRGYPCRPTLCRLHWE